MIPSEAASTVISQYANSSKLLQLIESFNDAVDPRADLERFYNLIWNIVSAEGYGLDVWGRIVGIGRVVRLLPETLFFGFSDALPGVTTFGFGPFYSGQDLLKRYDIEDDNVYRRLILAKAATNITNGSIPAINAILMDLFPDRGRAYVRESFRRWRYFGFREAGGASGFNQDGAFGDYLVRRPSAIEVTYVFEFPLEGYERSIVQYSNAIPRPAGARVYVDAPAA